MNPQISLLIPCHNAARFLPRLLECVSAQTLPFSAVLGYDDGSTDDTAAVARSFGMKMISGAENQGVAHARNQLAAAAKTEWIHFHDVDDLISPDYVARLAPWCNAAHDVVSCDADWVDETSREILIRWRYEPDELSSSPLPHLLRRPMGLNNSIIRRETWSLVGGCDETLAIWEDADVHVRMARSGARFHHLPEVLTWSLRRPTSLSHDYLKGWHCRLTSLKSYEAWPRVADVSEAIAYEAERAAAELIALGDPAGASEALALCMRMGGSPPTTRNPLLLLLKPWLPSLMLLRLQSRRRRRP